MGTGHNTRKCPQYNDLKLKLNTSPLNTSPKTIMMISHGCNQLLITIAFCNQQEDIIHHPFYGGKNLLPTI